MAENRPTAFLTNKMVRYIGMIEKQSELIINIMNVQITMRLAALFSECTVLRLNAQTNSA